MLQEKTVIWGTWWCVLVIHYFFPSISFSFASEIFLLVHTATTFISVHGHTAAKFASFVIYATFYASCLIIDYMKFVKQFLFNLGTFLLCIYIKNGCSFSSLAAMLYAHTTLCYLFIVGQGKLKQRSKKKWYA